MSRTSLFSIDTSCRARSSRSDPSRCGLGRGLRLGPRRTDVSFGGERMVEEEEEVWWWWVGERMSDYEMMESEGI